MTVGALATEHSISRSNPSGVCWMCGDRVEARSTRLVHYGSQFAHPECGLALWPRALPLRELSNQRFYPEPILAQIRLRRDAIEAQAHHRSMVRARTNAIAVDTSRFRAIEPLHDRRGRPVMRVYLDTARYSSPYGTLPLSGNYVSHLLRRTEKRSYSFEWVDDPPEVEDPAIATLGALVAVDAARQQSVARARAIASLYAMNIATPMLWIYGGDRAQRAKVELLMRSWLTNAGFSGDEAHCVLSATNDHAAFLTVLDAMDTVFIASRWPPLLASTPAELVRSTIDRTIETLDALIEDGDDAGVKKLVQIATNNARRTASEQEQRTASRSLRAIGNPALRPSILALCQLALRRDDAAPLAEWFSDECARAPKLTRDLETTARMLTDMSNDAIITPLVALLARSKGTATTRAIATLLERSTNSSFSLCVIEALLPHESAWPQKDPRAKAVSGVLTTLRERIRRKSARRREPPSKRDQP